MFHMVSLGLQAYAKEVLEHRKEVTMRGMLNLQSEVNVKFDNFGYCL